MKLCYNCKHFIIYGPERGYFGDVFYGKMICDLNLFRPVLVGIEDDFHLYKDTLRESLETAEYCDEYTE